MRFFQFATVLCRWTGQGSMSRAVISEICVVKFGSSPLLCFPLTQCLGQHWKAEKSRLVLCALPVSHLENSSPPAYCIINQKLNPLPSNVCEWWTISGPFCSVQGICTNRRGMMESLIAKYMLGIRDNLSSLPLPLSYRLTLTFQTDKTMQLLLFYFSVLFVFMNTTQRHFKGWMCNQICGNWAS